jgi:hypothetical protein
MDGVNLARAINSAQARQGGLYAPFTNLLQDRALVRFAPSIRMEGEDGKIGSHRVVLTLSTDRRHYQLAIVPDSGCGQAWFSGDGGVIYTGSPLGC